MKAGKKFLAIGLSAILSLSFLAGCNGGENPGGTGGETPGDSGDVTPETPETPDKAAPSFTDNQATVSLSGAVNKTSLAASVSGDLFGLFLEDINYASQALDDNLIANGNFESAVTGNMADYGWKAGNGLSFSVSNQDPLHPNSPNHAVIAAKAGGTLTNAGYEAVPMNIQNKKEYVFSAFFRGYDGDVTVSAKTKDTTCAEATFAVKAPDDAWIKVQTTLTATAAAANGVSLEIVFKSDDPEVLLDGVQFETKDSTAGIKNYMYNAIANLSPAFFRFPGGCVIEGKDMRSAYDWKNSIGAVKEGDDDTLPAFEYTLYKDGVESKETTYGEWVTRIPNANIWQPSGKYYVHEYGLGFYEYFLLCDTLGAKAIPIVNCGMACQTQGTGSPLAGRHNKGVQDYIQDAIDLIEFAKGDTTTEWGKIRADMGHEEPFAMDYIGIGNEQWGDYYKNYYEKFLDNDAFQAALKKYNVKPIVGNCTMFEHCENPARKTKGAAQNAAISAKENVIDKIADYGVVDQHYYVNYTDFLMNTDLYDRYQRPAAAPDDYYEVFVGEYAVNSKPVHAPTAIKDDPIQYTHINNSMITALAEAAMMTGFERNGDIVKLAAYAPMFGTENSGYRQWQVDMMYFSNRAITFTPNYYVQQLFMQNTGDYKVRAEIGYADGVSAPKTTYESDAKNDKRTCDDIFYVADYEEETGDVILKLVNAGKTTLKVNVNFGVTDLAPKGIADVWEISAPSAEETKKIDISKYKIGIEGNAFGYELQPYSVVSIRIRTK